MSINYLFNTFPLIRGSFFNFCSGFQKCHILLNSQNFFRSIRAGAKNPLLSRLCYRRLWGSWNRRALILGWVSYLDVFSSYLFRTWLGSSRSCISRYSNAHQVSDKSFIRTNLHLVVLKGEYADSLVLSERHQTTAKRAVEGE